MSRTGFSSDSGGPRSSSGFGSRGFSSSSVSSSSSASAPGQPVDAYAPSYLAEQRKSELNEMRRALGDAINKRKEADITAALEAILGAMTIGMDVSELFNVVIMAAHTTDLVQKKMIYLFLSHYAQENEKVALLAVNSLVKDSHDDSPMIRGLALRHLTAMRVPSLVEHIVEPLKRGLVDVNNYVRRAATMGCAKLFQLAPHVVKDPSIVNKLYELLRDNDPAVIVNTIRSLEEILADEGGMAINQRIVLHLLSKLTAFNEWGQCAVLKLLEKYTPQDDDELFSIMNVLDSRFSSRNTGLVMATIHLFLNYTANKPDIHQHVYVRIKNPLLSLLLNAGSELQYVILSHLHLLIKRVPELFVDEVQMFYAREKDPEYLKLLKVKIMQQLAVDANVLDIVAELTYYVTDTMNVEFSKESIRAIGRLAIQIPKASESALENLLSFLELTQLTHVMETTLDTMNDVLRRFPDSAVDIVPHLTASLDAVTTPNAVAAIISMIGDYGHLIEDSPYVLEEVSKRWETLTGKERAILLVGTLKLFFKRPLEVKPILGRLLKTATEDFSNPDVHDRALFLYRLLVTDIELCKRVVTSSSSLVNTFFIEDQDAIEMDRLFEEFNSLSVVYRKSSELFIKSNIVLDEGEADETALEEERAERFRQEEEALYTQGGGASFDFDSSTFGAEPGPEPYAAPSLLDGGVVSTPSAPSASVPQFQLNANAALDPPTFEKTWKTLPVGDTLKCPYAGRILELKPLDAHFRSQHIKSVAQGANGALLRFFLYAQDAATNAFVLTEFALNTSEKSVSATMKSPNAASLAGFKSYFERILALS